MNTIYEKNPKNWIWRFQTIDSYKALSNWQQRVFDILFLMMVNGTKKSNEQFSQLFNCSLTYWKETLKAFVDNKLLESNCKQVFNKELGHVMTTERILILNRNTFAYLYKNLGEDKIHRAIGFYLARVDPEEDSDKNE